MEMIEERGYPTWDNDLIMCPSQCYCYFEADGRKYCIYLRWRWDDPWIAKIVPVDDRCDFIYDGNWEYVDTKFYSHDDYKKLQEECINIIKGKFNDVKWLVKNTTDMETNFNFKSQVATSRVQSERLLALGLKKETADMAHQSLGATQFNVWYKAEIEDNFYPAWSLGRLIEMALKDVLICGISFTFDEDTYEKVIGIIEYQIKGGYFNKDYLV